MTILTIFCEKGCWFQKEELVSPKVAPTDRPSNSYSKVTCSRHGVAEKILTSEHDVNFHSNVIVLHPWFVIGHCCNLHGISSTVEIS